MTVPAAAKESATRLVGEVRREAERAEREFQVAQVARVLLQQALIHADEMLSRKT